MSAVYMSDIYVHRIIHDRVGNANSAPTSIHLGSHDESESAANSS